MPCEILLSIASETINRDSEDLFLILDLCALASTCKNWYLHLTQGHVPWLALIRRMCQSEMDAFTLKNVHFTCRERGPRTISLWHMRDGSRATCRERGPRTIMKFFLEKLAIEFDHDSIQRGDFSARIEEVSEKREEEEEEEEEEDEDVTKPVSSAVELDEFDKFFAGDNLQYITALKQCAFAMNAWIEQTYPSVRNLRRARLKTPNGPRFECDTLCPKFTPERFWYDMARFVGAASCSYVWYWQQHHSAKNIGIDAAISLQEEYLNSAAHITRHYASEGRPAPEFKRTWNVTRKDATYFDNAAAKESCVDTLNWLVCSSMGCDIRFQRKNGLRPFRNDTCGFYCSAWCFCEDAMQNAELECANNACRNRIALKHLIGINEFNRDRSRMNNSSLPTFSSYSTNVHTRVSNIEITTHSEWLAQDMYLSPTNMNVPRGYSQESWDVKLRDLPLCSALRNFIGEYEISSWPRADRIVGHLHPAQNEYMPRINLRAASGSHKAYCCIDCMRETSTGPSSTRCLNPTCRCVFEPQWAAASFECCRVTFVASDGSRTFKGYVCDTICFYEYTKARLLFMQRKRPVRAGASSPAKRARTE